jgi:hypothetical protein
MHEPLVLIIAVSALLVGVLVIILQKRAERRRSEEIRRQAAVLGCVFEERAELDGQPFATLGTFHAGNRRRIRNLLIQRRPDGGERRVFDYSYVVSSGKSSHTHRQTVAVFRLPGCSFPRFRMSRENLFHKIGSAFGFQDIDFADDPDFSERYLLRGENEEAVRRVFDYRVRQGLRHDRPGWSVEADGDWLVLMRPEVREKPERLVGFIQEVERVAELFTVQRIR